MLGRMDVTWIEQRGGRGLKELIVILKSYNHQKYFVSKISGLLISQVKHTSYS